MCYASLGLTTRHSVLEALTNIYLCHTVVIEYERLLSEGKAPGSVERGVQPYGAA